MIATDPKRFVKTQVGRALIYTGLWNRAVRNWARGESAVVLTYHRVVEKWDDALDYSQPGMVVTVPTFERQMSFLAEHFEIVSLSEAFANEPVGLPTSRPRCVITFDDGWRDNYELAFPVLRRLGLPATIFLATDFIGTSRAFWHTKLIYVLLQPATPRLLVTDPVSSVCPATVRERLKRLVLGKRTSGGVDVDPIVEWLKATCDEGLLEELVDRLSRAAGLSSSLFPDRRFFLDWAQVAEMAERGIDFESHGCSHRILTRVSPEEAAGELVRSKAEIERRVGRPVHHFAFPNETANDALVRAATAAGYRTACLGGPRVSEEPTGLRVIRRLGMHEQVCGSGSSFDEMALRLWLYRGPKSRPA